jgi:dTDP-4-amino-4,6-dideoxygalactose transaminase
MIGAMKRWSGIDDRERAAAMTALHMDLSGYLAGKERGGFYVQMLEDMWADTFKVKHAIACNSATSGLLAAAFAVNLGPEDRFAVSAMTMSATAAAPMFTGAAPLFCDVNDDDFGMVTRAMPENTKAIFSANLFGRAGHLGRREWDKECGTYLIEDNSQSPFAIAIGRYIGTMGHIGVWSLNVHKHIQCGEGGMITTDDDGLAWRLRGLVNHGENLMGPIGLNLRMPEVCAAIAVSQLQRGPWLVGGRVEQAHNILRAIGDIPGIKAPPIRDDFSNVFYLIPFLIDGRDDGPLDEEVFTDRHRRAFCASLRTSGVPIVEGYVEPLYRLPAFARYRRPCPVAEDLQARRLFYFENCAWDPTPEQIDRIGDAFRKAAKETL